MYVYKYILLVYGVTLLLQCENPEYIPEKAPSNITWVIVSSTNQIVSESLSQKDCPSGWTTLFSEPNGSINPVEIPLQQRYVTKFRTIEQFTQATTRTFPLIGKKIPTIRVSLSWPCFHHVVWREKIIKMLQQIQESGFLVELTLSHHDSYPAILKNHETPEPNTSGWAHPDAENMFISYVSDVIRTLKPILPTGTRVYLINEPVGMLFNSYLGSGKWPPGGKKSVAGFYTAMINMKNTLLRAGHLIQESQWEPAIAKNIRVAEDGRQLDPILDHIFNWWILDALTLGCADNLFTQSCEEKEIHIAPFTIGITYYGTMKNSSHNVFLKPNNRRVLQMPLPEMNFSPNSRYFFETIQQTTKRYPAAQVTIAEIGFSSGNTKKSLSWLREYTRTVQRIGAKNFEKKIGVHTLFESAEFSTGEWFFHIAEQCNTPTQCILTPWGNTLMRHISSL